MKIFFALAFLSGCVLANDVKSPSIDPVPTTQPTARPTLPPPLPPFSTPTPSYPARSLVVTLPSEAKQCESVLLVIEGPYEKDDVVIWAEKKHHVGRMFFNKEKDQKYLGIKLNTAGKRTLDIKINGEWVLSLGILVTEDESNCKK